MISATAILNDDTEVKLLFADWDELTEWAERHHHHLVLITAKEIDR